MGVIQGSINQLLTTAGIIARLSPKGEAKVTEAQVKAAAKTQEDIDIERSQEEQEYALENAKKYDPYTGKKIYEPPTMNKALFWGEEYDKAIADAEKEYKYGKYSYDIMKRIEANKAAEMALSTSQQESRNGRLER